MAEHIANAYLVSFAITIVISFGILSAFKSQPSCTITAVAPFSIALSIYLWPSTEKPLIAINKNPGFTFLELLSIPEISVFKSPLSFSSVKPCRIFSNFMYNHPFNFYTKYIEFQNFGRHSLVSIFLHYISKFYFCIEFLGKKII